MRAGDRISSEDDLQTLGCQGLLKDGQGERNRSLHSCHSFLSVVADAEEIGAVRQVVLSYEPDVRIEIGAVRGEDFQHFGRDEGPVLDCIAAGVRDSLYGLRAVDMDQGPQALSLRLTAPGLNLLIIERRPTAVRSEEHT